MCQILSCCSFFHRVYRLHRIIISLDIIKSFDFNRKLTSTSAVISHPLVKTGPCSTWTRNLKVIRSTPIGSIRTFSSEPRVSMTDKNPFLMYSPALKFSITFLTLTALVYRRVDRPPHSWERTHQLKQTWHSDLCETIHFASLGLVLLCLPALVSTLSYYIKLVSVGCFAFLAQMLTNAQLLLPSVMSMPSVRTLVDPIPVHASVAFLEMEKHVKVCV